MKTSSKRISPFRRIVFAHHKGGTGKTTACLSVAGWLSKMKQRVLVVDLDPQANATTGLGVDLKSVQHSISDVLLDRLAFQDIILETETGIFLAPASNDLLFLEAELARMPSSLNTLKNKMHNIDHYFDFILFDAPPGSTLLMLNGIVAARNIIIPLDSGIFGFETLEMLKSTISTLEESLQLRINVFMTLLKVFSPSLWHWPITLKMQKRVSHYLETNSMRNCNICTIPFSTKIYDAQQRGIPISHYAPASRTSKVFQKIAAHILQQNFN